MSQTIDSRVVEMKFDNKNFEKNVAESMKTLDALSKRVDKLEDTQVDFGKMQKSMNSFDLSKIDKALDSITHRFSIMGQVGASVINNITTDAYNMVKGFSSKVWGTVFGQMKTGGKARAQNVENSKFLLEGMGIVFNDEVDKAISAAVNETAFGYDEAAMAMAQLSGASVQLGDDMNQALRAISGVAAMTNRSFSDIADIFVDSAAAGKVAGDAFNRLAERGLAAKGVMQEFYGVTADELDKMAKKGLISFADFSKAMSDAFGDQAKKSNDTLNGVLANTRAVLSRMGQSFYQPLMANKSDVVLFFGQLKDTLKGFEGPVKEIGNQLAGYVLNLARWGKEVLKSIDVSKYEPVFKNISTIFENLYFAAQNLYSNILKPFGKIFKDALYEVFPSLNTGKSLLETISIKLAEASEKFRKFTSDIGLFGEKGASVKDVLVSIFNALKTGINILKTFTSIAKVGIKLLGSFLKSINFGGIIKELTNSIAYISQIGLFLISGIANGLIGGIPLLFSAITEVGRMIISAFCSFFGIASPSKVMRDKIGYQLVAGIAEGMKKALTAGLITGAIALVVGLILKHFEKEGESVFAVASRLFDGFVNKIAEVFNRFSKWISSTGFGKAVSAGFELITVALTKLSDGLNKFDVNKFKELLNAIKQMAILGAFIYILIQFAAASTMFTTALYNLSRAAKFYMSSMRIKYFGATLKNLAIALGVITGSILLFAGMIKSNNWKELLFGVGVIEVIIWSLVGAIKLIQGAVKAESFGPHGIVKVEAMFMGLATAVFLIASSIKKVGTLNWKQIAAGLIGLAGVIYIMGGVVMAMQALSEGGFQLENAWKVIVGIGVAVKLIAGSIKSLSKIEDKKSAWDATWMIVTITGVLGLISVLTQLFSKLKSGQLVDNITNTNIPGMFLAIGVAVTLIAHSIKTISKIETPDLEKATKVMYQIMGWMAIMFAIGFWVAKPIAGMLAGFGVAVAGIAVAVKLIGDMKAGVEQGFSALMGIMGIITVFIGAVNLVNKATGGGINNNGVKALLYAGLCIAAMGWVVSETGKLSFFQIIKGIGVVTALSVLVAGIGVLFGLNNNGSSVFGNKTKGKTSFFDLLKGKAANAGSTVKKIMMIKAIMGALVKVALVTVTIAKVVKDPAEIITALKMMAIVVGALGVLVTLAGIVAEKCPNVDKITKPIKALAGAILIIGGVMLLLGNMDEPGTVITSMMAIGGVLMAMGWVLEKTKVFGHQGMNTKGILACSVAIIAIGAALTLLVAAIGEGETFKDYLPIIAAVGAITVILLAIGLAMKIADKTKVSTKSAKGLLVATSSLLIIAAAIGGLAYFTKDMGKAGECALLLGGVIVGLGIALKCAEKIKWSSVGMLVVSSLSFGFIAAALAGLAYYVEDMERAKEAAFIMGGLLLELGVVLGILAAVSAATGGLGAGIILAIAGAMDLMALALVGVAGALYIGVAAFEKFIGTLTKENAQSIVAFFETIAEGIGTAGKKLAESLKECIVAFKDAFSELKVASTESGSDVAKGFAVGILSSKGLAVVGIAAAALGVAAIMALRGPKGLNCGTPSHETMDVGEKDFDGGFGDGIEAGTDLATKPAESLGTKAVNALKETVQNGIKSTEFTDVWTNIKAAFSDWGFKDNVAMTNPLTGLLTVYKKLAGGVTTAFGENVKKEFQNEVGSITSSVTSGGEGLLGGWVESLFGGSFDKLLDGFDFSKVLSEGGILDLKQYLDDAGGSIDALSGDNIPKLIERLKEAGIVGDDLIEMLKQLGITEDQLKSLGLADALGLDEAKEGTEELKTSIENLADEIIAGKFGNAPERWDRMFEALVKSGKTAEEAYASIAESQNEVNKRLGSSVVHTADEIEKKVSDTVKKANKDLAEANAKIAETEKKKAVKYGTKEYDEEVSKTGKTINTMPTKAAQVSEKPIGSVDMSKVNTEKAITAEKEKQVSLAEKEAATAALNANKTKLDNAALTEEKRKQLEAENAQYQKVVDTYNEQQKMVKTIQDQEAATKKAEDAEKKRGDAVKATAGAVVYGTDEYYKQTGKTGKTINTVEAKPKVETAPVQTETKVEVTPNFEIKKVDTTKLKTDVVTKVETEFKDLQAKATITPKIDTKEAEAAIASFKTKTQELKTSIPETFNSISTNISSSFNRIAQSIQRQGASLTLQLTTTFKSAANAAANALSSNEVISKFTSAGKSAAAGYANGIKAETVTVKLASASMGVQALKSLKKSTDTNSPSKEFEKIGRWNGIGYADGMINSLGYVADASNSMAEVAMGEVSKVVYAVQDAVNEGLDTTPVITPVVDTAGIQNSFDYINSSMPADQTAAIQADIVATREYKDSGINGVVDEINNMQSALDMLSQAILAQPTPEVNANVILQGDADGVFKLVQNSNNRYTKMHGKSAFA